MKKFLSVFLSVCCAGAAFAQCEHTKTVALKLDQTAVYEPCARYLLETPFNPEPASKDNIFRVSEFFYPVVGEMKGEINFKADVRGKIIEIAPEVISNDGIGYGDISLKFSSDKNNVLLNLTIKNQADPAFTANKSFTVARLRDALANNLEVLFQDNGVYYYPVKSDARLAQTEGAYNVDYSHIWGAYFTGEIKFNFDIVDFHGGKALKISGKVVDSDGVNLSKTFLRAAEDGAGVSVIFEMKGNQASAETERAVFNVIKNPSSKNVINEYKRRPGQIRADVTGPLKDLNKRMENFAG